MLYTELRAFHAVAEQGTFTRAAERLQVSQPTVSEQVKTLEERYRVKLFERRGRRVETTDTGRRLHAATARIFQAETEAEQVLAGARKLAYGRLRVGADSPYLVVPLLGTFKRRFPGIELSLAFGNTGELLEALLTRRVDVAVVAQIDADPRLYAIPLRDDRIVAMVPHGHPWAARRRLDLAELAQETVVLREQGLRTRAVLENVLDNAGIVLGETLEIGSREAIREAVAAGLGVGIVSESELGIDPRLAAARIGAPGLEVIEYAACVAERRPVRVVAAFFDVLADAHPVRDPPG